jgi:hypothetical protein
MYYITRTIHNCTSAHIGYWSQKRDGLFTQLRSLPRSTTNSTVGNSTFSSLGPFHTSALLAMLHQPSELHTSGFPTKILYAFYVTYTNHYIIVDLRIRTRFFSRSSIKLHEINNFQGRFFGYRTWATGADLRTRKLTFKRRITVFIRVICAPANFAHPNF